MLTFSGANRAAEGEDRIELNSVGFDVGSSTTHLVLSRLVLRRLDWRYEVTERHVVRRSEVLLTPYLDAAVQQIDGEALGRFLDAEYARWGLAPADVDTGSVILTGTAARQTNARSIGEVIARQAGEFVVVSAGDALEATMAAHGSGAVELSQAWGTCLNVDVGGGTTKLALCRDGEIVAVTAIDVGARLVVTDRVGVIRRIEPAAREMALRKGIPLEIGTTLGDAERDALVRIMVEQIVAAVRGQDGDDLGYRLEPLRADLSTVPVVASGGVSEYIHGREHRDFGDLGREIGAALGAALRSARTLREVDREGIGATVMGVSQFSVRLSGSSIFVDPAETLPLRNLPVVVPALALDGDDLDEEQIAAAAAGLADVSAEPVAIAVRWRGSATYRRIAALAEGLVRGMRASLDAGLPLVLVFDGDIGGVFGMHVRTHFPEIGSVVSIDGIEVKDFDYLDIGRLVDGSGVVPVVVKSLIFPGSTQATAE